MRVIRVRELRSRLGRPLPVAWAPAAEQPAELDRVNRQAPFAKDMLPRGEVGYVKRSWTSGALWPPPRSGGPERNQSQTSSAT